MKKIVSLIMIMVMSFTILAVNVNAANYTLDFNEVEGTTVYLKKNQSVQVTIEQTSPLSYERKGSLIDTAVYWKDNLASYNVKTKLGFSINDSYGKNVTYKTYSNLKDGSVKTYKFKAKYDGYYTFAIRNITQNTKSSSSYRVCLPTYNMSINNR